MHEAVGFSPVSVFQRVGYKFGQWHDVGWWQLSLHQELPLPINSPLSLLEVQKLSLWNEALRSGLLVLRV
ncbi:GNAT family N-acetyltransferase [Nostoc flagelliforme]|uniref:GNAT family N-acetyltransferase n=1 Tax=Nostoc flagelliforme TaxID=1306274 RepID=UPI001CECB393|nr:hypothetical protein [Nostoc flagelliforme]